MGLQEVLVRPVAPDRLGSIIGSECSARFRATAEAMRERPVAQRCQHGHQLGVIQPAQRAAVQWRDHDHLVGTAGRCRRVGGLLLGRPLVGPRDREEVGEHPDRPSRLSRRPITAAGRLGRRAVLVAGAEGARRVVVGDR